MSANSPTFHGATATHFSSAKAESTFASRKNSYSRKRWSAFDTWQEHVRKSADSVGVAFSQRHDRDMRRAIVGG